MRVRELQKPDLPVLEKLHRESGFDYPFPDFFCDEFVKAMVVVDDEDRPVQVFAAKKSIEMFMLVDPNWKNPRWRLEALMYGHEEMRQWLLANDWKEANVFLPPEVQKSFGRRLEKLFHWIPGRWKHYSRRTEG